MIVRHLDSEGRSVTTFKFLLLCEAYGRGLEGLKVAGACPEGYYTVFACFVSLIIFSTALRLGGRNQNQCSHSEPLFRISGFRVLAGSVNIVTLLSHCLGLS